MEFYGILNHPVFSKRSVANKIMMTELEGDRQRLDQEEYQRGFKEFTNILKAYLTEYKEQ